MIAFVKKEKNVVKLQMVILSKSHKLLTENLHKRPPIQNIQWLFIQFQRAGYVTAVLAIVCAELRAQEVSTFCEFF